MAGAPFQTQTSTPDDQGWMLWLQVWGSEPGKGDQGIQFLYWKNNPTTAPFFPLGDCAWAPNMPPTPLLYAPTPEVPDALANPVDFTWILDDKGSGNEDNLSYWWPVAPPNYVALGVCFTNEYQSGPTLDSYWCVHERYCIPTTYQSFWTDAGQGWAHHNGDLMIGVAPANAPANLIVPQTLLSVEAMGNGMGAPYVLSWT